MIQRDLNKPRNEVTSTSNDQAREMVWQMCETYRVPRTEFKKHPSIVQYISYILRTYDVPMLMAEEGLGDNGNNQL